MKNLPILENMERCSMRTWCYVLQQHYEIIIIIVFYRAATCYHKHNVSAKRKTWRQQGSIRYPNIGTILYLFKCVRVITRKTCAPKWCPLQNVSLTKTSSAANSHYVSNQTTESWSLMRKFMLSKLLGATVKTTSSLAYNASRITYIY